MNAPHTTPEYHLDHGPLGEGTLAQAMEQWRPTSHTDQRVLIDELLSQARAASNVLTNICEHRAVMCDDGGGRDVADAWDVFGLADLLSSLLEVITVVQHQDGSHVDAPICEWPSPPCD